MKANNFTFIVDNSIFVCLKNHQAHHDKFHRLLLTDKFHRIFDIEGHDVASLVIETNGHRIEIQRMSRCLRIDLRICRRCHGIVSTNLGTNDWTRLTRHSVDLLDELSSLFQYLFRYGQYRVTIKFQCNENNSFLVKTKILHEIC